MLLRCAGSPRSTRRLFRFLWFLCRLEEPLQDLDHAGVFLGFRLASKGTEKYYTSPVIRIPQPSSFFSRSSRKTFRCNRLYHGPGGLFRHGYQNDLVAILVRADVEGETAAGHDHVNDLVLVSRVPSVLILMKPETEE